MSKLIYWNICIMSNHLEWQDTSSLVNMTELQKYWLFNMGSLSSRLAECCDNFGVSEFRHQYMSSDTLSIEEKNLIGYEPYLKRQVILQGDNQDWVYAYTLIPESSQKGPYHDFKNQGDTPIGMTIFNTTHNRDELKIATFIYENKVLFARRSRLWINDNPILVVEFFLPDAPVYSFFIEQARNYDIEI